jgi:hypothetical protein
MKTASFLIFLLLAAILLADEASEKAAQSASEPWLGLLDSAKYGESWDQASTFFKGAVTKDQWAQQVGPVREQTGKFQSRKLKSSQYVEDPPNSPPGKYVALQYDSTFASGAFLETVFMMQEKDGTWKSSGYFVKPA